MEQKYINSVLSGNRDILIIFFRISLHEHIYSVFIYCEYL